MLQPAALPTELPGNKVFIGRALYINKTYRRRGTIFQTSKSSVSSSSEEASVLPLATAA